MLSIVSSCDNTTSSPDVSPRSLHSTPGAANRSLHSTPGTVVRSIFGNRQEDDKSQIEGISEVDDEPGSPVAKESQKIKVILLLFRYAKETTPLAEFVYDAHTTLNELAAVIDETFRARTPLNGYSVQFSHYWSREADGSQRMWQVKKEIGLNQTLAEFLPVFGKTINEVCLMVYHKSSNQLLS